MLGCIIKIQLGKQTPSGIYSGRNLLQGSVYTGDRVAESQRGDGEVIQRLAREGSVYILRQEDKARGGVTRAHGLDHQ